MSFNRAPDIEPATPMQPTLLVVEDDAFAAAAIDVLLQHYGYTVVLAPTLGEARRHLSGRSRPDVIVLDLGLPDGSGLDLLEEVRSDARHHTRVVVLTADVNPDHLRQLKRLRPERFLRKPMNFLDLLDAIRGEAIITMSPSTQTGDGTTLASAA